MPKHNATLSEALDLDRRFVWHPFTQMHEWRDPAFDRIVIAGGKGAVLTDASGRRFLDGNSSIWTNLHGHRQPRIDAAIRRQLNRIAHCSFLGLTNDVAPLLAAKLVRALRAPRRNYQVFFSDDGATAIEAALKIAIQARHQRGELTRTRYLSIGGAYHGDTVGAMSLGNSPQFHRIFKKFTFTTTTVPGPHCYRCPHNRAASLRGVDQRDARRCEQECFDAVEKALSARSETTSAIFMEPRVQGAAGLWMHPPGFLRHVAKICQKHGIWLALDEVMTGFGRAGSLFACQLEGVQPDLMAVGKGITGGYLPLAATIVSGEIFDAFLGAPSEGKTFLHGHSYTGNPLACAAALASLELLQEKGVLASLKHKQKWLRGASRIFWRHPNVGDVRQQGMICGIELVKHPATREPFSSVDRTGANVCRAAQRHGLLTRPVGDVLVLMPPYCSSQSQIRAMANALFNGLCDVLPLNKS